MTPRVSALVLSLLVSFLGAGSLFGQACIQDGGSGNAVTLSNCSLTLTGGLKQIMLGNGQGLRDPGSPGLDLFTSTVLNGGVMRFFTGGTSSAERMRIDPAGHVGIGTDLAGYTPEKLNLNGNLQIIGPFRQLVLGNAQGLRDPGGPGLDLFAATANGGGSIRFLTGSPTVAERMRIEPGGNVVVTGNLQVSGDITGARVFNAVYQDLAEWVPSTEDLAPGTVVVLNGEKNNEVMASTRAYDTMVAGVVSAQPGIILGVGGKSKETVATTGRVRVRVDATSRPVRVGDLLVTSMKPGMAMTSEPVDVGGIALHRPGTILGKALEPLPQGEGEVLVLLSLQ